MAGMIHTVTTAANVHFPESGGDMAPPYVRWETLRDTYLDHFGPLLAVEEEVDFGDWKPPELLAGEETAEDGEGDWDDDDWDDDEPEEGEEQETPEQIAARLLAFADCVWACDTCVLLHYELTFARLTEEDPRVVTASFGAASHAGHEVFLVSAVPFSGFNGVVSRLAREHAPLAPGRVIPVEMPYTPFTAVLLAPEGSGSILLAEAGGASRWALRVVPLTASEARLGGESVERLVAALRAAGALEVVDPLRDCVVAPRKTQGYWALMRAPLVELTEHRLQRRLARYERLVALEAPAMIVENERQLIASARLLLRHIEQKPVDHASPAERWGAMFRRYQGARDHLFRSVQGLFERGAVPAALRQACAVVVGCTIQGHPVAQRLVAQAEGDSSRERFDIKEMLPRLVRLIGAIAPDVAPEGLFAGGQIGELVAREKCAMADGFIAPHLAWEHMMAGMCLELVNHAPETEQDAQLAAFHTGVTIANVALVREDARPPLERVEAASKRIVREMVKAWLETEGLPVDTLPGEEPEPARAPAQSGREARRARGKNPRIVH